MLRPKMLYANVAVAPAPLSVPSQMPLVPVSSQLRLPANDKGDNEMIPGAVHRSPGIYLTAEDNRGKPQLGDLR